jgi:glucosamine 6-phosphate synthetase-like amidotransferase/phosphosugar isomerase protein
MCGIFGFVLNRPVPLVKVFKVLAKLEVHQYPHEPKPVGGFGAGIAVLGSNGKVLFEKVGHVGGSPVKRLSQIVNVDVARVLVGHVRMPSPQFVETAKFKETAQPYVTRCFDELTLVSAHNGNVANYKALREKIGTRHLFESEKIELIDSEIIPHLFEELLSEKTSPNEAVEALFQLLEGSNTVSVLQIERDSLLLHFIHKGKTRGLTIWKNNVGEIIFCSRKEPLMEEFKDILSEGEFKEHISIPYGEEGNLKTTLSFKLQCKS